MFYTYDCSKKTKRPILKRCYQHHRTGLIHTHKFNAIRLEFETQNALEIIIHYLQFISSVSLCFPLVNIGNRLFFRELCNRIENF